MGSPAGFFNRQELPVASQPVNNKTWVSVGGDEGERWLRQVAVCVIDKILSNPRANRALSSHLMALHKDYFSSIQPTRRLLRSDERLTSMVNTSYGMEKMIHDLAFIFRQLTVDELGKDPKPEVFFNHYPVSSLAMMRNASVRIHDSAITALENQLQITIKLNNGLSASEDENKGLVVYLKRLNDHYYSLVQNADRFLAVNGLILVQNQPNQLNKSSDPELSVVLARIRKNDERLFKVYNRNLHRLVTMVHAGEVNRNQLLNIYIKSISVDKSPESRGYAGVEHGTCAFFEKLINRIKQAPAQLLPIETSSHEEQLVHELTHALARSISVGLINEEQVYEQLEDKVQTDFLPQSAKG